MTIQNKRDLLKLVLIEHELTGRKLSLNDCLERVLIQLYGAR